MQTRASPVTNRKPGRLGVFLCLFLLVGFTLSFLGQPVQAQDPLAIPPVSFPEATAGSPYTATVTATGGMPPYMWAITAGALPLGLSLDSATGVISGVPLYEAIGSHVFIVTVTDMHGNIASNLFSITVADFYTATVTIDMSLLQPCQTMVYVDGEPTGDLKGGESLTLSFSLGTTHTVSVDSLVADPGNEARRFTAVDAALTVTEASPDVIFQYSTEYSVSCKTEPPDIIGLPSPDWYPEGSTLTASATEEVDGPTGTQYRFAHWQLPAGETMADPQLSVTVGWGGEIVAVYDTFYLLTVFSEYGTPEGSGYYKADISASWSVTPAEVEMSGFLGFLGGKLRTENVEGTEIMTAPKTVSISWQSDYMMPILIGALVLLFIGLGSYVGYRYAVKRGAEPKPEPAVAEGEAERGICTVLIECKRCHKTFGECGLPLPPKGKCGHRPVPRHKCPEPCPKCGRVSCDNWCPCAGGHSFKTHPCIKMRVCYGCQVGWPCLKKTCEEPCSFPRAKCPFCGKELKTVP